MSISIDKLFREVPKLIKKSSTKRFGLSDGMNLWIDYCEELQPGKVWSRLRKLDFETDFDRLTLWLTKLLLSEPPGREINGLWFGLFNPVDDDGAALRRCISRALDGSSKRTGLVIRSTFRNHATRIPSFFPPSTKLARN